MGDAIGHALRNLTQFQGRDRQRQFWLYILFICLIWVALSLLCTGIWLAMVVSDINQAGGFEAVLRNVPNDQAPSALFMQLFAVMKPLMWGSALISLLIAALTIASFVRRLHDSNLSGYWALLPYGMLLLSMALLPYQMQLLEKMMVGLPEALAQAQAHPGTSPQFPGQAESSMLSLIGWVQMISFILLALRGSTVGPNRFGDEPPVTR